jgi:2-keto-4-pentenoate hydratase/2-oxohepta-3-ene-1,7-dioic acid hydratase in catechol pathway
VARLANREGRALLLSADGTRGLDVADASHGELPADPMALLGRWVDLCALAARVDPERGEPIAPETLDPCVPRPQSVFAIGLNYRDHAEEAGLPLPTSPMVFTKFPSCLAGPAASIALGSDRVDWEVELVVVIGRAARAIRAADALEHVAGYCVGQDVSDRRLQFSDKPPQFSLGKSLAGYGPIGPAVVSLEHVADPNDLHLTCEIDGERVQDGRTRDMVFAVPELIEYLSRHCVLAPGDLIFTGTPAGVGSAREPRRYLAPGELLTSRIDGLGQLRNRCVAAG